MCNLRKFFILAALLCLSAQVSAVTVDLGGFDGSNTVTTKTFIFSPGHNLSLLPGGAIDAKVAFNVFFSGVPSQASSAAGAFSLELDDILGNRLVGVDNISGMLMGGTLAAPVALATTQTTAGVALSYAGLLGAGNYMLTFAGDVPASYTGGGSLTGSVSIAAVPVPAAIWLFGSAMVGFIGFRRRKENAVVAST